MRISKTDLVFPVDKNPKRSFIVASTNRTRNRSSRAGPGNLMLGPMNGVTGQVR